MLNQRYDPANCANTPEPEAHPCEGCSHDKNCTAVCVKRARWWDRQMKKVREQYARKYIQSGTGVHEADEPAGCPGEKSR